MKTNTTTNRQEARLAAVRETLSEILSLLKEQGFKVNTSRALADEAWMELATPDQGKLRVVVSMGDENISIYKFAKNDWLEWKMDNLSTAIPTVLLKQTLMNAIDYCAPLTVARPDGRRIKVTVPRD